ncbi:hypothetical protein M8C21_015385, partial [Ambrosia artemisiifolia]
LKDLQVFTIIRVIFQLCEEIPYIFAAVVALLFEPLPFPNPPLHQAVNHSAAGPPASAAATPPDHQAVRFCSRYSTISAAATNLELQVIVLWLLLHACCSD